MRHHFFKPLYRHVSIFALEQLQLEHNLMLDLSDYVFDKCGFTLQTTHGLLCAFYFYLSLSSQRSLYLNDIYPLWRTLTYTEVGADTNEGGTQTPTTNSTFNRWSMKS